MSALIVSLIYALFLFLGVICAYVFFTQCNRSI